MELIPSLAELSLSEAKYQNVVIRASDEGEFGVTLRYFSIQPSSVAVSAGREGRVDGGREGGEEGGRGGRPAEGVMEEELEGGWWPLMVT